MRFIYSRDRAGTIWQNVRDHISSIILRSTDHTFLAERAVTGLLRLSIRLLCREEVACQVSTSDFSYLNSLVYKTCVLAGCLNSLIYKTCVLAGYLNSLVYKTCVLAGYLNFFVHKTCLLADYLNSLIHKTCLLAGYLNSLVHKTCLY